MKAPSTRDWWPRQVTKRLGTDAWFNAASRIGARNISLGDARMRSLAVSDLRELVEEQLVAEIKRYRR